MKPTSIYAEMSVGILDSIYNVYGQRGDAILDARIDDYRTFSFIESLWNEPNLSLKSLIK